MDKGSFNRLTNALIFRNCEWRVAGFRSNKISIKNDNEVAGGAADGYGENERKRGRERRERETQRPGMSRGKSTKTRLIENSRGRKLEPGGKNENGME